MSRQTVAYINRAHGAYLIHWAGTLIKDHPDDELWDAASSLVVAKRVAREGAEQLGYVKPYRWEQDGHLHTLVAGCDDEDEEE